MTEDEASEPSLSAFTVPSRVPGLGMNVSFSLHTAREVLSAPALQGGLGRRNDLPIVMLLVTCKVGIVQSKWTNVNLRMIFMSLLQGFPWFCSVQHFNH